VSGRAGTARVSGHVSGAILTQDRDRPGTYVALVEFGSHPAAMANPAHPAAGTGSPSSAISRTSPTFRNLDVTRVRPY